MYDVKGRNRPMGGDHVMMTPNLDDFILIFVGGPGGFTNEIKKNPVL